jgi:arsenate reductase
MSFVIYHNRKCSKSRKTLDILHSAGIEPSIVDYLQSPPDGATILDLATRLGVPVKALLRRGENAVRQADDLPDLDDERALANWIADHPVALQRPIVVDSSRGRAVIGRPPETVMELLS